MSRTRDEVAVLLAEKFKRESARLKSWGTKTDDKAAYSFASCVLDFVRSLMADSRYRELKRVIKKFDPDVLRRLNPYLQERLKATKAMTKALENFAVEREKERTWNTNPIRNTTIIGGIMNDLVKVKDNEVVIDFWLLAGRIRNPNVTLAQAVEELKECFKEIAYTLLQVSGEEHKV